MSEQQAPPEPPEPEWPTCKAEGSCTGIRVDGQERCLAHVDTDVRTGYLAGLRPGGSVDLRGTPLSAPLLDAVLAATRTEDGSAVLGDAMFRRAQFSGSATFDGVRFSGDASFGWARFAGFAGFAGARFCGDAGFAEAQFSSGAQFDGARFSGAAMFARAQFFESVGFFLAEFSKDAWFSGVVFSGRAGFERARFLADARFDGAQFPNAPELGPLLVAGHLALSYARFGQAVTIDVAAAHLLCVATTFEQAATLRARYAEIVLDGAVFAKPATLAYAEAGFGRWIGRDFPTFDETLLRSTGRDPRPRLLSLRKVDVSGLGLAEVNLEACLFWGAYHLDLLRIEGPNPFPFTPRGWHLGRVGGQGLPVWRWTKRQTVADEHAWRAALPLPSTRAGRPHPKRSGWRPPPSDLLRLVEGWTQQAVQPLEPDRLALLYRRLRKGREDAKNEPGAADFYYGEMEMRRRAIETPWAEKLILTAYWLVSGYSLRAFRALLTLLAVVAGVAVLFQHVGFEQPATPPSYFDALLYAAESTLSLPSGDVQLTAWGRVLRIALRLTGPVLLGLALLSVRNRVKR
jgi:uncharacterized protein YjbI with pentapeptide repeats